MYRINSAGTLKYRCQALNLQQKNKKLFKLILEPNGMFHRLIATLPILWIYKQQDNDPGNFKDSQVYRENIRDWLVLLMRIIFCT